MTTIDKPRFLLLIAGALALVVSATGIAPAASSVKPSVGDYEPHPAVLTGGIYTPGAFAVVNDGGKRRIVSTEVLPGILYPDYDKCSSANLPLSTESIPISKFGKFSVRDKTPIKNSSILVVWKGHWSTPIKVSGTIKIEFKQCSSQFKWAATRAAPTG